MAEPVTTAQMAGELVAFDSMALPPTAGGPAVSSEVIPFAALERAFVSEREADGVLAGLRRAGPLALAGLASNAANVIVTVLVARLLSTREYGGLAQLLSVFLIISMPGSAVLVGVVRRAAAWEVAGRRDLLRAWAVRLHRLAFACVVGLGAVTFLAQGTVAHALSLPSTAGVFEILTAGGVWVMVAIDRGLLQSQRAYRKVAGNLLVEGGVRTVLTVGLTLAGLGLAGAATGILLAEILGALHVRWLVSRELAPAGGNARPGFSQAVVAERQLRAGAQQAGQLARDVGTALASLALVALLQNADLLVLGRRDPGHVGQYAAISVASKALVFGALALGGYLLPEAAIRWHRGSHALRQLGATGLMLALPALGLLLVSLAMPGDLLRLVFGARLSGAAPAFATLVGAMIFLSTTVVLTNYLLGVGWRWIVLILAGGAVLILVLVWRARGVPVATARADLLAQAVLAGVTATAFTVVHHRSGRRA
ncbi:MAG: lipopolysaccharide biosynthesis protein [Acidimicrobiales bacterium]